MKRTGKSTSPRKSSQKSGHGRHAYPKIWSLMASARTQKREFLPKVEREIRAAALKLRRPDIGECSSRALEFSKTSDMERCLRNLEAAASEELP